MNFNSPTQLLAFFKIWSYLGGRWYRTKETETPCDRVVQKFTKASKSVLIWKKDV
jgi:hypothetical protein